MCTINFKTLIINKYNQKHQKVNGQLSTQARLVGRDERGKRREIEDGEIVT